MPYFATARFELVGEAGRPEPIDVRWSIRREPYEGPANHVGYFHASYVHHPNPAAGEDLRLLDTTRIEEGGDWFGSFVGTSFIFSHEADLTTLEGNPRFDFDDPKTPQAQGTGTEEWGGGDDWGGLNMTLPFAGHQAGAKDVKSARSPEDRIESAYRFLLADLMPPGTAIPPPRSSRPTCSTSATRRASPRLRLARRPLAGRGRLTLRMGRRPPGRPRDLPGPRRTRADDDRGVRVHLEARPAQPRRAAPADAQRRVSRPAGRGRGGGPRGRRRRRRLEERRRKVPGRVEHLL